LSIWLNSGTAKLQYTELRHQMNDCNNEELLVMTSQERLLLRVLVFWAAVLIFTSWFYPKHSDPGDLVGIIVNFNLIVFYGAPLKTIQTVIHEQCSASIHYETMVMNWITTSFSIGYGMAKRDLVIVLPNIIGLLLGIAQGVLCLLFPRQLEHDGVARVSLRELDEPLIRQNEQNPEQPLP